MEDSRVMGILTRQDLIVELAQRGRDTLVGDAMQREGETVDAADMLPPSSIHEALRAMTNRDGHGGASPPRALQVLVVDDDRDTANTLALLVRN
jgi:hypothetical protein